MKTLRFRPRLTLRFILLLIAVLSATCAWYAPQLRAAIISCLTPAPDARFTSRSKAETSHVWSSFEQMHGFYINAFVESEGFGVRRMVTFDEPYMRSLIVNGKPYRVQRMELISLHEGKTPFAYVNGSRNPVKNGIADAEQRMLTNFERSSIVKIQKGRDVVYNGDQERPLLVGAMRASARCIDCHSARTGDVIGCMSYELVPVSTFSVDAELLRRLGGTSELPAGTKSLLDVDR